MADPRTPITDEEGEARELTEEDFRHARHWRPGDPFGRTTPDRLRDVAAALRAQADALEHEADALERAFEQQRHRAAV